VVGVREHVSTLENELVLKERLRGPVVF
jgi:hypothetical protein